MNSIDSISAGSWLTSQGMRNLPRPNPAQAAENLFSKLDSSGQDYIEKVDLQAAFDQITGTADASSTTSDIEELFALLDGNADGKVTKEEFTDSLQQALEQLDGQLARMRLEGGDSMPPPPPPPGGPGAGNPAGFTEEELSEQLEEIGSSDDRRSELLSSIIENFDEADANGDGRVSLEEAMAFDKANPVANAASDGDGSNSTGGITADLSDQVLKQIIDLMRAYGSGGDVNGETSYKVSVSA